MKNPQIQVRRKPRQSRAKLTQEALQDSFVRLLHERAAHDITIREITDLAGVGLGTFYEYFSKKEDLIALTIHRHVKNNAEDLKTYAQSLIKLSTDMALDDYLKQVIHYQLEQIQAQQFLWAQTFLLERQISNIESYRKSYEMMVQMWQSILSPFMEDTEQLKRMSLNVQRVCYGFVSQTLLIEPEFGAWRQLENSIWQSI
ncbi:TetR/AcrR family transcriptional regulator [Acinetobacter sp. ANC 4216]|uniref:TetR/AcrR family transcriptional regulator n=1 Tax=unclassified Acinetobacter TaxID=196816 RepID=UPI00103B0B39|nr:MULTISPECIES: TetR/AcrR family transcriptional regulator [unclassified Acinetobacter]MCT8088660.1 TetR/AcrR family transcriptional regulator [Acinetobacter sp. F_3_1]MCT8096816.1 TetR/AcrR family transcriptional regulator [Acinetobacter sp. C_3_1]MCT8099691.1 TetR/AcrR family transcriptional regulator [Acinetobacter sp. C_4_1]MCT8133659.1 TetR/AcrR family transcriptional regulator [Acinetobacter sp. T_3_1]TCB72317.1 TetR/AcrR family transcriptional regulator [Acinetobacter sp. ANC 4216]